MRAYLDLVHITDSMVEFYRSTLLHAVAVNHGILTRKWRSSARSRRHCSSHGRAAGGCRNSVLKLIDAVLLLPVHSLLLLLTRNIHWRNVGALHSWTNVATTRAHHHLVALPGLWSVGAIGAPHTLSTFLTTKRTWLGH